MFTGIVEEVGVVGRLQKGAQGMRLQVEASLVTEGTGHGDSICVSGVCLTVEEVDKRGFTAFLSPETTRTTTLGDIATGGAVNLERALTLGGRLGGHLVSGHVECRGRIRELLRQGEAYNLIVEYPQEFAPFVVPRGSVSVDGVSLTIVRGLGSAFSVAMIPETFEKTTFRLKTPGDYVNLEPDLILKYVISAVRDLTMDDKTATLTLEKLREAGFITD